MWERENEERERKRMENVVRMRVLPSCLCQWKLQQPRDGKRSGGEQRWMKWEIKRDVWMERKKKTVSLMKWEGGVWWHELVEKIPSPWGDGALTIPPLHLQHYFSPDTPLHQQVGSANKGKWLGRTTLVAEAGVSGDITVVKCCLMSRVYRRETEGERGWCERFGKQNHFVFLPWFFLQRVYCLYYIHAAIYSFATLALSLRLNGIEEESCILRRKMILVLVNAPKQNIYLLSSNKEL